MTKLQEGKQYKIITHENGNYGEIVTYVGTHPMSYRLKGIHESFRDDANNIWVMGPHEVEPIPEPLQVKIYSESGSIPQYATKGSACFDISAYTVDDEIGKHSILIEPGESAIIPTGIYFEIPEGYVLKVYSRSGHGFKHGVSLSNGTGILDSDYRGELKISLMNLGPKSFVVENGDRIAQGLIEKVEPIEFITVSSKDLLSETTRGEGGFGHTGSK